MYIVRCCKCEVIDVKERDAYFDNAKAILILSVILGHVMFIFMNTHRTAYTFFTFIYFFHMPAFALISGFFSKKMKNLTHAELKYLGLFILFTFIFAPFSNVGLIEMFIDPYYVLWYLFSLVCWYVLIQIFIHLKHPIVVTVVIAVLAGYVPYIGPVASLSRTIVFFPFFVGGYSMSTEVFKKLKTYRLLGIFMMFVAFMVLQYIRVDYHWLHCNSPYGVLGYTEWYIGGYRLVSFAVSAIMVFSFFSIVPSKKVKFTIIGEHTLILFVLQGLLFTVLGLN